MSDVAGQSGTTFVEMLIALAVVAVLAMLLTRLEGSSIDLTSATLVAGHVDQAAKQTACELADELRWARPGTLLITAQNGSTRIDYEVARGHDGQSPIWSSTITIRYQPVAEDLNGNGLADEGCLVRTQDGRSRVLCRNVLADSFSITRTGALLDIQLTVFGRTRSGGAQETAGQSFATLINREDP
ncbi:MAG: prepilin-type N-terminal cleavage/methylation domain-containing protein [Planctomycetes bacterium]|nr:prepilin-type N-terminal cleavage/methylation domain-containing protein [Planctomycetota bacterium]